MLYFSAISFPLLLPEMYSFTITLSFQSRQTSSRRRSTISCLSRATSCASGDGSFEAALSTGDGSSEYGSAGDCRGFHDLSRPTHLIVSIISLEAILAMKLDSFP